MDTDLNNILGQSVLEHFSGLDDPRVARAQRHSLLAIVTIALCGVICGAESWVEIAEFGRIKADWFATFLELPYNIPSHDTFGRVFAQISATQFEACFAQWMQAVVAALPPPGAQDLPVIALDGKTVRRSHNRSAGQNALHLVSAWASAHRLTLAQVAVAEKSNEITAFPTLLRQLDVRECLVTIDAMGCQREIAQQIVDQGAEYVLALKENQETLYEEVSDTFALARASAFTELTPAAWSHWRDVTKGHGRLEIREHWVLSDPAILAYLQEAVPWPALGAIGLVEAERRMGGGATTAGEAPRVEREARYYLLSTALDAQQFGEAVRAHWGIENQLHWLLDVAFREDESRVRIGDAAENFAVLRRMALHLLKQETSARCGIRGKRLKAGWSTGYLLQILSG